MKKQLITFALLVGMTCTAYGHRKEGHHAGKMMKAGQMSRGEVSIVNDTNKDFERVELEVEMKHFTKHGDTYGDHIGYITLHNLGAGQQQNVNLFTAKHHGQTMLDRHFEGDESRVGSVTVRHIHASCKAKHHGYSVGFVHTNESAKGTKKPVIMLKNLKRHTVTWMEHGNGTRTK